MSRNNRERVKNIRERKNAPMPQLPPLSATYGDSYSTEPHSETQSFVYNMDNRRRARLAEQKKQHSPSPKRKAGMGQGDTF